ncbi:hypothetical protein ACHAXN_000881 [Cyclotella atomus]
MGERCDIFKCQHCDWAQHCKDCGNKKCIICTLANSEDRGLSCLNCLSKLQMYHKSEFERISDQMSELQPKEDRDL